MTEHPALCPCDDCEGRAVTQPVDLRDHFASAALISMHAHPANEHAPHVAQWAYEVADAMMAERVRRKA